MLGEALGVSVLVGFFRTPVAISAEVARFSAILAVTWLSGQEWAPFVEIEPIRLLSS